MQNVIDIITKELKEVKRLFFQENKVTGNNTAVVSALANENDEGVIDVADLAGENDEAITDLADYVGYLEQRIEVLENK